MEGVGKILKIRFFWLDYRRGDPPPPPLHPCFESDQIISNNIRKTEEAV